MRMLHCDREQAVVDAVVSGRWESAWGEEIRRHAAGCAICSEVALLAQALRREDEAVQAELCLPSAGLVWWKAQLAARRAAEERAAQPIALMERAAQALAGLAAFGLAVWQWPRIVDWLGLAQGLSLMPAGSVTAGEWTHRFSQVLSQGFSQPSGYLILVSAGAFVTLMGFAAYLVWREE
ncbi:MAG TPA: hypothetical protein VFZ08_10915 [Terriglobia bacterium]|nr:hypothetical protein [Terriglobia bacterium]